MRGPQRPDRIPKPEKLRPRRPAQFRQASRFKSSEPSSLHVKLRNRRFRDNKHRNNKYRSRRCNVSEPSSLHVKLRNLRFRDNKHKNNKCNVRGPLNLQRDL
jgi:hypothetical protein